MPPLHVPPDGVLCVVTVDNDGTTVSSMGGTATTTISDDGNLKLNAEITVDISTVEAGLVIKPGEYEIQPDNSENAYDVTFGCPAGGVRCKVTAVLNYDGSTTVTSVGGQATVTNSDDGDFEA